MTEKLFRLIIITPEGILHDGNISALVVPAESGYLGVLANHAPLMAGIVNGRISFQKARGERAVLNSRGGGFLEVYRNKATLLLNQGAKEGAT